MKTFDLGVQGASQWELFNVILIFTYPHIMGKKKILLVFSELMTRDIVRWVSTILKIFILFCHNLYCDLIICKTIIKTSLVFEVGQTLKYSS